MDNSEKLRHLQLVILSIAKDIERVCNDNGITYFLFGGTALGAIRHNGFIPWDDDFDIAMDNENYNKFIKICREKLDPQKYYIQEGFIDWPMPFTKIVLRGTYFEEKEAYINKENEQGIFVDVFKFENAPTSKIKQLWQYICAKVLLCHLLFKRGLRKTTIFKRILLYSSFPLYCPILFNFFKKQVDKYNNIDSEYVCTWCVRFPFKGCFHPKKFYKKDNIEKLKFEDIYLPVSKSYDEILSSIYGDYMTPPPPEKRMGLHLTNKIDFGKY